MSDDEQHSDFEHFSREYAEALKAFAAIETQASTIVAFGGSDELRTFVAQFLEMAGRTKAEAEARGETHFVEWFGELIRKAEALRSELASR
jgi:hypothetical protein